MVDIEGAVVKPGVYSLPLGSRLKDGLIMAGGLSASADREKIAKSMNLAARLTDGAKVYFPKQGEISSTVNTQSGVVSSSDVSTLININEASEGQLDTLYGVGPATAQKIIGGRPYSDIQELLTKKIVSRSVFDKIKDRISIN
jgi:competence protein ComEA